MSYKNENTSLSDEQRFTLARKAQEEKRQKALNAEKQEQEQEQRLQDHAHVYLDYIETCIDKAAAEGYGSLEIKIDRTYDMFGSIENPSATYSLAYVVHRLYLKGYELKKIEDLYDAYVFLLTFLKGKTFTTTSGKVLNVGTFTTSPVKVGMYPE